MAKNQKQSGISMALLQLYQGGDVVIADGHVVRVLDKADLPSLASSHQKWFLDPVVLLLHPDMKAADVMKVLSKVSAFLAEYADDDVGIDAHHLWQW